MYCRNQNKPVNLINIRCKSQTPCPFSCYYISWHDNSVGKKVPSTYKTYGRDVCNKGLI